MQNNSNSFSSVYLKDFKGFPEICFQLADVNFLVGENSTGKTAILKLLNLLSSSEFWIYSEFNTTEVELGYFDEILNKNCGKDAFYIGMEKFLSDKTQKRIAFEVKGKDNIPQISSVKILCGVYDIIINLPFENSEAPTFTYKPASGSPFKIWAGDWNSSRRKKTLPPTIRNLPLNFIINLVEQEAAMLDKAEGKRKVIKKLELNSNSIRTHPLFAHYLWIAPIRAKPKRIYESYNIKYSPEGDHIPFLLRKLISQGSNNKRKTLVKFLEKFGKESNLFDKIVIKRLGRSNSSPFEINVSYNNVLIKLTNVGYGVSQSLPLVIEILSTNNGIFSIQQPEVHLHPKAQAAFGSLIFNSSVSNKNRFIIETHSDFTINRFRYELHSSKRKKSNPTSQILFFERDKSETNFKIISLKQDGQFESSIPDAYRDFFIDEELKLLEL